MQILIYPACSTCRKAVAWLRQQGYEFDLRHIVDEPPTANELAVWTAQSGLPVKKWFNTSGVVYKERQLKTTVAAADDNTLLQLLASDGRLVKRPVLLLDDGRVLLGFKPELWSTAL